MAACAPAVVPPTHKGCIAWADLAQTPLRTCTHLLDLYMRMHISAQTYDIIPSLEGHLPRSQPLLPGDKPGLQPWMQCVLRLG